MRKQYRYRRREEMRFGIEPDQDDDHGDSLEEILEVA